MTRHVSRFATIVLLSIATSWLLAADTAPPRIDAVSQAMQPFVENGQISGIVTLLAKGDRIVHLDAVGRRGPESAEPMRVDDLFWIASMTKPITATAVLILQDEGKLSVEDKVSKFIPAFADAKLADGSKPKSPILIRHLLTHSAGLAKGPRRDPPETRTLEEQSRDLVSQPLQWSPGEKWEYGMGLQACGRIIEVASGLPYDVFVKQRILDPLGMVDTTFEPSPEQRERMVIVNQMNADKTKLINGQHRLISGKPGVKQTPMPSGGLFSTARNLHRFYAMILNGGELEGQRIVSREAVKQMTTVQSGDLVTGFTPGNGWGLGWCIVREPQGVTASLSPGTFGHGGAYGTQGWVDPQTGVISVLLIQRSDLGNSDGSEMRKAFHDAAKTALSQ